jgi:indolepyruvate ferredoxin oxidoreductase beta subunit
MNVHQNIIIAGVGGQGILTLAAVIGRAALDEGLHVKQSEVHGMAQRGGAVLTHMRLSDAPIASDLVPFGKADLLLSMEPMEALRYLPFASPEAVIISNCNPVRNVAAYPDLDKILARIREWPRHLLVDAEALAKEAGAARAVNSVMLGVAAPSLCVSQMALRKTVAAFFERKGSEVVEKNLAAFDSGRARA